MRERAIVVRLVSLVTGSLIGRPSTISIAVIRGKGIRICRLRMTPRSVNGIVKGRNEVTGTVHSIIGTTTVGRGGGVSISVIWGKMFR